MENIQVKSKNPKGKKKKKLITVGSDLYNSVGERIADKIDESVEYSESNSSFNFDKSQETPRDNQSNGGSNLMVGANEDSGSKTDNVSRGNFDDEEKKSDYQSFKGDNGYFT